MLAIGARKDGRRARREWESTGLDRVAVRRESIGAPAWRVLEGFGSFKADAASMGKPEQKQWRTENKLLDDSFAVNGDWKCRNLRECCAVLCCALEVQVFVSGRRKAVRGIVQGVEGRRTFRSSGY